MDLNVLFFYGCDFMRSIRNRLFFSRSGISEPWISSRLFFLTFGIRAGILCRLFFLTYWVVFLMQFGGSWKIKVLVENDHKKAVFSTVDFNGRFKGRIHVILRLLIFTCLVLGC